MSRRRWGKVVPLDATQGVALLIVYNWLQARIALLEGERRSFDNVKLDLMRRIKMLEYALRVERYAFLVVHVPAHDIDVSRRSSKQLAQPAAQSVPPAKLASLQSQIALASQKDDASSGSSPRSEGLCLSRATMPTHS